MKQWDLPGGLVGYKLTAADPARAMDEISSNGIAVYDAKPSDQDIVTTFYVRLESVPALVALSDRRGYLLERIKLKGIYWTFSRMLRRPILMIGMLLLFAIAGFLPNRVLFVKVEGNDHIPQNLILEKSAQCGIGFGASRGTVRSEKVKNRLLEAIPELEWVGVNTVGCVATVSVRERTSKDEEQKAKCVCSLIATRDGMITRISITGGNGLIHPGQSVRSGQVLVSGYTDHGICIHATHSEGEIYAYTSRELAAVTPDSYDVSAGNTVTEKKYAIILGKKRINFYKGSGISGTSCDKIYSESYLTLPGGFQLPVRIITETWTFCDETSAQAVAEPERFLAQFAQQYLLEQMVAGQIKNREESYDAGNGTVNLRGYYACEEMIAQVRKEEIIKPYGNDY